jgi:hypothetical protein
VLFFFTCVCNSVGHPHARMRLSAHVGILTMLSGSHKKKQVTGVSFEVSSHLAPVWIVCIQAEICKSTQLVGFLGGQSIQ